MLVRSLHAVEKAFGMLGEPQHERKIASDIKLPPFVLSPSKDSDRVFQQALYFDLLAGVRPRDMFRSKNSKNVSGDPISRLPN
jgi:hypothetical protein